MPLVDHEITAGAEQLEKAASRKRSHAAAVSAASSTAAAAAAAAKAAEDENDRLVREALSQFYLPPAEVVTRIIDDVIDVVADACEVVAASKRPRLMDMESNGMDADALDVNGSGIEIIDVVGFEHATDMMETSAGSSSAAVSLSSALSSMVSSASSLSSTTTSAAAPSSQDDVAMSHIDVSTVSAAELDFELGLVDHNQNQKEFDVILDALRLGTGDSCGQAAMMGETGAGAFHNLVVASLET